MVKWLLMFDLQDKVIAKSEVRSVQIPANVNAGTSKQRYDFFLYEFSDREGMVLPAGLSIPHKSDMH